MNIIEKHNTQKLKSALDETDELTKLIFDIKQMAEELKKLTADKHVISRIDKMIQTCKNANLEK